MKTHTSSHSQKNNDPDKKLSGVFHRDDCIQHVHTQMINWHGPTGTIFSVDIQPQRDNSRQRVATGGADSRVQVWELLNDSEGIGSVDHLSELNRHDCAVNVVRFHPTEDIIASASDDRCMFLWRLDTSDLSEAPKIFAEEGDGEKVENRENWTVIKQFRGHGSEVYDIAWSPDARYLASGTMDNTTYVWDTNTCRKVAMWQHHKSYVQGVAWDPNNKLVTTMSSDRSAMVYGTKKFKLVQRISKIKTNKSTSKSTETKQTDKDSANSTTDTAPAKEPENRDHLKIFLDTGMVDTFFRRPGFSPDGNLVAYPCGCYEIENDEPLMDTRANPSTSEPLDDKLIQINVVYLYQTKNLESPVMCLPTGNSPAIAVRFCPQLFKIREGPSPDATPIFKLPYRMVYAVVTLDNVLLYDTQQTSPFASIGSIHYEQLTDASWSSDGGYLMVSSIDGFCTIVTINKEKLGEPYRHPTPEPDETEAMICNQNTPQSAGTSLEKHVTPNNHKTTATPTAKCDNAVIMDLAPVTTSNKAALLIKSMSEAETKSSDNVEKMETD